MNKKINILFFDDEKKRIMQMIGVLSELVLSEKKIDNTLNCYDIEDVIKIYNFFYSNDSLINFDFSTTLLPLSEWNNHSDINHLNTINNKVDVQILSNSKELVLSTEPKQKRLEKIEDKLAGGSIYQIENFNYDIILSDILINNPALNNSEKNFNWGGFYNLLFASIHQTDTVFRLFSRNSNNFKEALGLGPNSIDDDLINIWLKRININHKEIFKGKSTAGQTGTYSEVDQIRDTVIDAIKEKQERIFKQGRIPISAQMSCLNILEKFRGDEYSNLAKELESVPFGEYAFSTLFPFEYVWLLKEQDKNPRKFSTTFFNNNIKCHIISLCSKMNMPKAIVGILKDCPEIHQVTHKLSFKDAEMKEIIRKGVHKYRTDFENIFDDNQVEKQIFDFFFMQMNKLVMEGGCDKKV